MSDMTSISLHPPCGGAIKETVQHGTDLFVLTEFHVYRLVEVDGLPELWPVPFAYPKALA